MSETNARSGRWRGTMAIVIAVLVAASITIAMVSAVGASDGEPSESLEIELEADGSATVTMTLTYDLADDDERAAFESLQDDDGVQEETKDRFEERMSGVAGVASDRVDRDMSVSNPALSIELTDGGDVGVVEIAVTWDGLAAVEDDRLVVTEPFASGYEADHSLTISAPDGYTLVDATPEPDEATENSATWAAGSDLDGFEVSFQQASDYAPGDEADDADGMPGFGVLVATAAIAGAIFAIRRLRPR